MPSMSSAQRQVELRRLGNQLPVLGKANSLCEVGNVVTTRDINDSETVLSPGRVGPGIKISRVILARAKSM